MTLAEALPGTWAPQVCKAAPWPSVAPRWPAAFFCVLLGARLAPSLPLPPLPLALWDSPLQHPALAFWHEAGRCRLTVETPVADP